MSKEAMVANIHVQYNVHKNIQIIHPHIESKHQLLSWNEYYSTSNDSIQK